MKKKTVMVVDDDQSIREFISVIIQQLGHIVIVCESVELALIGFIPSNYDLVITDLFMDGMGGIKGIEEMHKRKPDVPIIAISAGYANMSGKDALRAAEKIGANGILPKPFTVEELTEIVNGFLDR